MKNSNTFLGRRLVSALLAASILLSQTGLTAFADATDTTPSEITSLSEPVSTSDTAIPEAESITEPAGPRAEALLTEVADTEGIKITNGNGDVIIDNGQPTGVALHRGDTLYLYLAYIIKNAAQVNGEIGPDTDIYYPLPSGLNFSDVASAEAPDSVTEQDDVLCTYYIKNNVLHFSPTEKALERNRISGNFTMQATLDEQQSGDGDSVTVTFAGDTLTFDIPLVASTVTAAKRGTYNKAAGTADFTVTLTMDSLAKNVELTDVLGADFRFADQPVFTLKAPDGTELALAESDTAPGYTRTDDNNAVLHLGSLKKGVYTLTYTVDVVDFGTNGEANKNKINWTWGDNQKGDTSATIDTLKDGPLTKSGSKDTDGSLKWTVTLNNKTSIDLAGATVCDDLTGPAGKNYAKHELVGTVTVRNTRTNKQVEANVGEGYLYRFPTNLTADFGEDATGRDPYTITYNTRPAEGVTLPTYTNETLNFYNKVTVEKWSAEAVYGYKGGTGVDDFKKSLTSGGSYYNRSAFTVTYTPRRADTDPDLNADGTFNTLFYVDKLYQFNRINPNSAQNNWTQSTIDTATMQRVTTTFDESSLVVKAGSQVLTAGSDYTVTYTDVEPTGKMLAIDGPRKEMRIDFADGVVRNNTTLTITYTTETDRSSQTGDINIVNWGAINGKLLQDRTSDWGNRAFSYDGKFLAKDVEKQGVQDGTNDYIITWRLTLNSRSYNLSDHAVTLTDTLPAGLSYVGCSYRNDNGTNLVASAIGASGPTQTVNADGTTILVWTFTNLNKAVKVLVDTKVDPNALKVGSTSFTNTASLNRGETPLGEVTKSTEVVQQLLDKTAIKGDTDATYAININRYALPLQITENGVTVTPETLTLKDTMSGDYDFDVSKVVIYKMGADGSKTLADDCTKKFARGVLTVTVPNSRWYRVEYPLAARGTGANTTITNSAVLQGILESSVKTTTVVNINHVGAQVTYEDGHMLVTKRDSATSKPVGSADNYATFALYRADGTEPLEVKNADSASATVEFYTDNTNGPHTLYNEVLYYVEEVKAPAGYVRDTGRYYFVRFSNDVTGVHKAEVLEDLGAEYGLTADEIETSGQLNVYNDAVPREVATTAEIKGTKYFFGTSGGTFTFNLQQVDENGSPIPGGTTDSARVTFAADDPDISKAFTFNTLEKLTEGTTYYLITEEIPENPGSISYDEGGCLATVTCAYDENDRLNATVTYQRTDFHETLPDGCEFYNNEVSLFRMARRSTAVTGEKILLDASGSPAALTAGQFRFELFNEGDLSAPIATATNNKDGTFALYLSVMDGQTHRYVVREQNGGLTLNGIRYSDASYTVTVSSEGDVTVDGGSDIKFVNQTAVSLTVNKVWAEADSRVPAHDPVTVHLYKNGDTESALRTVQLSAANGWSHTFEGLTPYENGSAVVYTVGEDPVAGYEAAVAYNEATRTFTVTNTYSAAGNASVTPEVTKVLEGRTGLPLTAGEFAFTLSGEGVSYAAANDAEGKVVFPLLRYTEAGTHTYTIAETKGNDAHIEYDSAEITLTVTVTEQEGRLNAEAVYADKNGKELSSFTNVYHPVVLRVQKTSKDGSGDPLYNAVYGLWMVNESGNDSFIGSCPSDQNGYMTFNCVVVGAKYYFKEISAPTGHTVDEYPGPTFTVAEVNGQYRILYEGDEGFASATRTSLNRARRNAPAAEPTPVVLDVKGVADEVTKLNVYKLDAKTHENLPGASLQILEKATGKVVHAWTSGDKAEAIDRILNVDTVYILRETKVPDKYALARDTEFSMDAYGNLTLLSGADAEWVGDTNLNLYNTKENDNVVVTVTNEVVRTVTRVMHTSPKTGDAAPLVLVGMLMVAGVLGIIYLQQRKHSRK